MREIPPTDVEERLGWRCLLPVVALTLAAVIGILAASLPRADAQVVAAVFPPGADWSTIVGAVDAVDGRIVRTGAFGNVVIVSSDRSGLVAGLRAQGAWLVLDPIAVGGCAADDLAARPAARPRSNLESTA